MNFLRLLPAAILIFAATLAAAPSESLRQSVVLLKITPLQIDPSRPWVKTPGAAYFRPGLVVEGRRILVLAGDIQHSALIEVRKYSSNQTRIARRERFDREADLALLSCEEDFFSDLKPVQFDTDPVPGDALRGVKMDSLLRFEYSDVSVRESDVMYITGMTPLPVARATAEEPFGSGGVLLKGSAVAGFVYSRDAERSLEFLYPSHLQEFVRRARDPYQGFVSSGLDYESIVDPALKRYYGVEKSGVLIHRVYPGTTATGVFEPGDILASLDGKEIDERGFYEDAVFGRQRLDLLFARNGKSLRAPGETIAAEVLRAGKRLRVSLSLKRTDGSAIRLPVRDENPPYHVESGIVFIELSLSFLTNVYGNNHASQAPELSYLFTTNRYRQTGKEERIVIVSRILPDDANLGYESAAGQVLLSVNGTPVGSIESLRKLLSSARGIVRFELKDGRVLYVDLDNRAAVNERIRRKYSLPE